MSKRPLTILLAGIGINLSIGVLYAWSVFKDALVNDLGWTATQASTPYSIAIVVFSIATLTAGVLQDKFGPRRIIMLGGAFVGSGMILTGLLTNPTAVMLTFGVVVGSGIGFAYACVTPAAMKWWHPSKKGMVSGLIVGGFGLGAVYVAPLTKALVNAFDIQTAFIILGTGIIAISVGLGATVVNPPKGYVAEGPEDWNPEAAGTGVEMNWREMIKTRQFYFLFIMFALASSAGVMLIGNITQIGALQVGLEGAVYLVSLLAIANAAGRVLGGMVSDKIGRVNTLIVAFVLQAANMWFFMGISTEAMLIAGAVTGALCYGALLSVFPSLTADYFGLKGYGANYGLVYIGWGLSGALGPVIASLSFDSTGSFNTAYVISAAMLAGAALIAFMTKAPSAETDVQEKKVLARA
ncbi:sugar phosphate permease [Shimia isoporae]|uniref:Sugar phosphate permease n=1 Tax=Shimia isoporae TaxID=647720 RepID=A0A4R1N3X1_9RHOB|nr:OFA family MFS transporter [Shimia isoporae]TCL01418.1 sugar phosphate permease [Shimia isoporae]